MSMQSGSVKGLQGPVSPEVVPPAVASPPVKLSPALFDFLADFKEAPPFAIADTPYIQKRRL